MLIVFILTMPAAAQQTVSFPTKDGGQLCGDLYGRGHRAVVLAHGGQFNKESWKEQAQISHCLARRGGPLLDFCGESLHGLPSLATNINTELTTKSGRPDQPSV
jgi:hypothetical protein